MSDNERLDKEILESIKGGSNRLRLIQKDVSGTVTQIDRRLQALRREKKVMFESRVGWTVPKEKHHG